MQHPNKILKDFKRLHLLYKKGAVFTSFDTETSSLSPSKGRIIEIGAIKFNNKGIIQSYQHLFNPGLPIPTEVENLTHISNQMLLEAPKIEEYLPQFIQMIKGSILIAHNAQFDLNFLNFECEKMNLSTTKNPTIDTLQYSYFKLPELEKHKLDYLADYFKINKGSSHRAFDDANTCMELFKILVNL